MTGFISFPTKFCKRKKNNTEIIFYQTFCKVCTSSPSKIYTWKVLRLFEIENTATCTAVAKNEVSGNETLKEVSANEQTHQPDQRRSLKIIH